MKIRNMEQSAEKKKDFVQKVVFMMMKEGLTVTEANAIPGLLERRLEKIRTKIGEGQEFSFQEEDA